MKQPIVDMLEAFSGRYPRFSMPGHKGKGGRQFACDITELPGTDNLHAPEKGGCIAASQRLAAEENMAAAAFYGVNGSSGAILAMMAYLPRGSEVIVARDMHISVENALRINGILPIYVWIDQSTDDPGAPLQTGDMLAAIEANPHAKAVFITYPNYYGRCAEAAKIAAAAHAHGMLLFVDSAHGAHLAYRGALPLPPSAGEVGADIWCCSYHKTLPALNQSAVLFCSAAVDAARLKDCLNCFQTTSPSYPLLASIDHARALMSENGEALLAKLLESIRSFKCQLEESTLCKAVPTDEATRLLIDVSALGRTGFECLHLLHARGIEIEGADQQVLLLITSVCDSDADFSALARALAAIEPLDGALPGGLFWRLKGGLIETPQNGEKEWLPTDSCVGKTAARSVYAYPPGVPIVLAGQKIDAQTSFVLASMGAKGYNLLGMDDMRLEIYSESSAKGNCFE